MARCPHCGKEIDLLYCERLLKVVHNYDVRLDSENELDFEFQSEEIEEELDETFYCPECGEEVAKNPNEARKFLLNS